MIGKDEGRTKDEYHIHVSAVTVAPEYRKLQVGTRLMNKLEDVGNAYKCMKNLDMIYIELSLNIIKQTMLMIEENAYQQIKNKNLLKIRECQ